MEPIQLYDDGDWFCDLSPKAPDTHWSTWMVLRRCVLQYAAGRNACNLLTDVMVWPPGTTNH